MVDRFSVFIDASYRWPESGEVMSTKTVGGKNCPIIAAFAVATIANATVLVACSELFSYQPDIIVKPLFGNPLPVLAILLSTFLGIPLTILSWRNADSKAWVNASALVLNLMPLPLCAVTIQFLAYYLGLTTEN